MRADQLNTLTARGRLLHDVLAGRTVSGVSRTAMVRLCADLYSGTPRRFCRAHGMPGGGYRVTLIGPPEATR